MSTSWFDFPATLYLQGLFELFFGVYFLFRRRSVALRISALGFSVTSMTSWVTPEGPLWLREEKRRSLDQSCGKSATNKDVVEQDDLFIF